MNLFEFANERESIRLLREAGVSAPWTKDERMNRLHFGNIFREDDPTTQWIHKHMIQPNQGVERSALFAACVSRMFGTVEALAQVVGMTDVDEIGDTLDRTYRKRWRFTSQYEATKRGYTRRDLVRESLHLVKRIQPWVWSGNQMEAHRNLRLLPGVGPMCANEIIADLQGTSVFPDGRTSEYMFPHWCIMVGLGVDSKKARKMSSSHPKVLEAMAVMRGILEQSRTEWRYPDRPWTLTTAARAALLYGQYINEDYSRRRSR